MTLGWHMSAEQPTEIWFNEIHERLLKKDPIASAELVENTLDLLVRKLTYKFCRLNDLDIIHDAVVDALLNYVKRPEQFNPSKRGLFGYLLMAAEGDLKNALAKNYRVINKETKYYQSVELSKLSGNIDVENKPSPDQETLRKPKHALVRRLDDYSTTLQDPKDIAFVELLQRGERSTTVFAKVLGIDKLPVEVQRKEVKKTKDRIKKRLERSGDVCRE
jgi:RNA polymerase sigma-70 factor (ECF subfamily)